MSPSILQTDTILISILDIELSWGFQCVPLLKCYQFYEFYPEFIHFALFCDIQSVYSRLERLRYNELHKAKCVCRVGSSVEDTIKMSRFRHVSKIRETVSVSPSQNFCIGNSLGSHVQDELSMARKPNCAEYVF